jgi:hypothetical protein
MATMYVETYRPCFPETGVKIKVHKEQDYSRDVLFASMTSILLGFNAFNFPNAVACVIEKAAGKATAVRRIF